MIYLIAFFGAVLGVIGLTALLATFLFWYEAVNDPCEEVQTPEPGVLTCAAMFLRTLKGYATGVIYHPLGWISLLFRREPPRSETTAETARRAPVILVHGIYHNAATWTFHKTRLESAGHPVLVYAYHSFNRPLDDIIAGLNNCVEAVEARFPNRKPILVGHSLGGLLIRRWLTCEPRNATRAQGVITLATPHGGSKLAGIATGALVRRIKPSSDFIRDLKAAPALPGLPCVSFVSDTDEMVLPSRNLLPPEGWTLRVAPKLSHFGFLVGQPQFERLHSEIQRLEAL